VGRAYSATMAQEQADAVRRSLDGWNSGDLDTVLADFQPDTEYVVAESFVNARTMRSTEEIKAYLRDWRDTVRQLRFEIRELVEGDEVIVTIGKVIGRAGADDGPEITADLCFVTRFDGTRMVRVEEYLNTNEALAAAGLD
jgi:ketosteroid isomerase-like protein